MIDFVDSFLGNFFKIQIDGILNYNDIYIQKIIFLGNGEYVFFSFKYKEMMYIEMFKYYDIVN